MRNFAARGKYIGMGEACCFKLGNRGYYSAIGFEQGVQTMRKHWTAG